MDEMSLKSTAMVRAARNLGFSVRYFPYSDREHTEVRAEKPAELGQMFIRSGELQVETLKVYDAVTAGQIKLVVASTGAGKSTKLPMCIASKRKAVVVVLQPQIAACYHVYNYVSKALALEYGMNGKVHLLSSRIASSPLTAPAVLYGTVGEFMALLASDPALISKVGIDCLVLDECHEKRPEYEVFRYLQEAGKLSGVKILYCSATAAGDMNMESDSMRSVVQHSVDDLRSGPGALHTGCPQYAGNIKGKTMFFVPFDSDFQQWVDYYESEDIPVMTYGYCSSIQAIEDVGKFFKEKKVCVLLCVASLQTSFTFDVDVVIDQGLTAELKTDFSGTKVELAIRDATHSELTQRSGRVGRMRQGVSHTPNIESYGAPQLSLDGAAYVWLWAKVFGIRINRKPVSDFADAFGAVDRRVAAYMLTSALPPWATRPYFSETGAKQGFGDALSAILSSRHDIVESQEPINTERWLERVVSDPDVHPDYRDYRCVVTMPPEFAVVQSVIWHRYTGDVGDNVSVAHSVITELTGYPPVKPGHISYATPRHSLVAPSGVAITPPRHRRSSSSAAHSVKKLTSPPPPSMKLEAKASGSGRAEMRSPPPQYIDPSDLRIAPSLFSKVEPNTMVKFGGESQSRVEHWVASTNGSSSSSDRALVALRYIDKPSDHYKEVFLPWDEVLREEYVRNCAVTRRDKDRLANCISGKTKYGLLSRDTERLREQQKEYFLSFLRCHEATVTAMLQHKAGFEKKKFSLFSRDEDMDYYAGKLKSSALLLDMCSSIGYKVGIQAGHVSVSEDSSVNVGLDSERAVAKCVLALGSDLLKDAVKRVAELADVVLSGSGPNVHMIANGWYINGRLMTAAHVLWNLDATDKERWCGCDVQLQPGIDGVITIEYEPDVDNEIVVREPVDGDHCVLVAKRTLNKGAEAYGFHKVEDLGGDYVITGKYLPGFSGALMVSITDGAIIGMYMGPYHTVDGVPYSRISRVPQ